MNNQELEQRFDALNERMAELHDRLDDEGFEADQARSLEQFKLQHDLNLRAIALQQAMHLAMHDKVQPCEIAGYARTFVKILAGDEPKGELVAIKE